MPLNLILKKVAIDQLVVDFVFSLCLLAARKISYEHKNHSGPLV